MAVNKLSDKKLKSLYGKSIEKQQTIADGNGLSIRLSKQGTISLVMLSMIRYCDKLPAFYYGVRDG
ncbi:hypothetical protein WDV76_07840 [Xenorhabdus griffiniae]|uniref:hypothetical protein n=1 Tax=Xenorhabdus griffiniae TaxID=351672 RepID=UPI002359596C|nr:hypothetical protein [Xenorhabdus griffiniae]MDC9606838.1 hypothetical protein [Xenorhabdus griffiniae]